MSDRGRLRRNQRLRRWLVAAGVCWGMYSASAFAQRSALKNAPAFQDAARRADSAREAGEIHAAIQLYEKAVRLNPAWQEGLWYLGSLEYDSNQYSQAAAALRRLTTLNSKMGAAWALLGLSEYETKDLSHAFSHLQRARRLGNAPELAHATDYHLSLLFNLRGEFEKAQTLLSRLVLAGVNSEDVQVGLGLSLLRVPLLPAQVDPSKDALIHDAGNVGGLLAHSEHDRADLAFRNFLKKYASVPFAHYAYGTALAARGKDEDAEAQFQEETAVTPDSGLAFLEWAYLEFHNQRYTTALPLARNAVKLAPTSSMAYYVLGSVLLAQGETSASIPLLETARRLAPASPEVRYSLSRAYGKTGRSKESRRERAEFARLQSKTEQAGENGGEAEHPGHGVATTQPRNR